MYIFFYYYNKLKKINASKYVNRFIFIKGSNTELTPYNSNETVKIVKSNPWNFTMIYILTANNTKSRIMQNPETSKSRDSIEIPKLFIIRFWYFQYSMNIECQDFEIYTFGTSNLRELEHFWILNISGFCIIRNLGILGFIRNFVLRIFWYK